MKQKMVVFTLLASLTALACGGGDPFTLAPGEDVEGKAGNSGDTGKAGNSPAGEAGTSGASGANTAGTAGTAAGTSGAGGSSGTTAGTSGSSGAAGTSGASGSSGAGGSAGTSGAGGSSSGSAGTSGSSGAGGASGSSGTSGSAGSGTAGTSGAGGSAGASGAGAGGSSGTSGAGGGGTSGAGGSSGTAGTSGSGGSSGACTNGSLMCGDADQPLHCDFTGTWQKNGGVCNYGCDASLGRCKCSAPSGRLKVLNAGHTIDSTTKLDWFRATYPSKNYDMAVLSCAPNALPSLAEYETILAQQPDGTICNFPDLDTLYFNPASTAVWTSTKDPNGNFYVVDEQTGIVKTATPDQVLSARCVGPAT